MDIYLPDTNIFIYAFRGKPPFAKALEEWITNDKLIISAIVAAEFLGGGDAGDRAKFNSVLDKFGVVKIDRTIAELAAEYKRNLVIKKPKLLLPDALIAATSKLYGATLVTENKNDFPMTDITRLEL